MTAASRLPLLSLCFLLLASCASVQTHFVDPSFKAQGLEGSVITLKGTAPPLMLPYGLAPQDEREMMEDASKAIRAGRKDVQLVPKTSAAAGDVKPAYCFEIHLSHDRTDRKMKGFKGFHRIESTRYILSPEVRTRVRRTVGATYSLTHLPSQRVVWRVSGRSSFSDWYRINLASDLLPPDRRPNIGPPLSEVLRPLTRKACAKLP